MLVLDYSRAQTLTSEGNDDIDSELGLDVPFVVVGVRIHYKDIKVGGGATTTGATVTISRVSHRDTDHNVEIFSKTSRGIGADLNLAVDPMIYERWRFDARDKCKVEWTTLDSPNIGHGLSIRAVPIASG
jgi:hypothetical protein